VKLEGSFEEIKTMGWYNVGEGVRAGQALFYSLGNRRVIGNFETCLGMKHQISQQLSI
jgi:hypothetical protein